MLWEFSSLHMIQKIHIIFLIPFPFLSQLLDLAVKSAILIAAWIESELSVFPSLKWHCAGSRHPFCQDLFEIGDGPFEIIFSASSSMLNSERFLPDSQGLRNRPSRYFIRSFSTGYAAAGLMHRVIDRYEILKTKNPEDLLHQACCAAEGNGAVGRLYPLCKGDEDPEAGAADVLQTTEIKNEPSTFCQADSHALFKIRGGQRVHATRNRCHDDPLFLYELDFHGCLASIKGLFAG
jgi:hypothetical protein